MSTKQQMIKALRAAANKTMTPLARSTYSNRTGFNGPEASEIVERFGTWNAALRAAGLLDADGIPVPRIAIGKVPAASTSRPASKKPAAKKQRQRYARPDTAPLLTAEQRMRFIKQMKRQRIAKSLTDGQLAQLIAARTGTNVTTNAIRAIQTGRRSVHHDLATAIAEVLGFAYAPGGASTS